METSASHKLLQRLNGLKFITSRYLDIYEVISINSKNISLKRIFIKLYTNKLNFIESLEKLKQNIVSEYATECSNESVIPNEYLSMMPDIGYTSVIKNCYQIENAIYESCKSVMEQTNNTSFKNNIDNFLRVHKNILKDLKPINLDCVEYNNQTI